MPVVDSAEASTRVRSIRFRRSFHRSPHYYLALTGLVSAVVVCVLNLWAYYNEGLSLTMAGFIALLVTTTILAITWFWGGLLLMFGVIVPSRLAYLIFHATLGSITPPLYALAIGLQIDSLGRQPVGDIEVELEIAALLVLSVQLISGWVMLKRRPWHSGSARRSVSSRQGPS